MSMVISVIYVVHEADGNWVVHGEHASEILGRFASKEAAIETARGLAREKHGQQVVRRGENEVEFAEDFASVEG